MVKTPLLLVPGLLCSPRLYGPQMAALKDVAEIVVPDWRQAPLSIFDSWDKTARWVIDRMPAGQFALAGLSLGGMIAVEIMQVAAERVTKLALLGRHAQPGTRPTGRAPRPHSAGNEGHFELVLGLQMSRFLPAYRLPEAGRRGHGDVYRTGVKSSARRSSPRSRRPSADLPRSSVRPSWCAVATMSPHRSPFPRDRRRHHRQQADRDRAMRTSHHDGETRGDERDFEEVALLAQPMIFFSRSALTSESARPATSRRTASVCSPSDGGGRES